MKTRAAIVIAIAAGLCAGAAGADDHLFQAMQHGLSKKSSDQPPFATNKAGHSGDLAPGTGQPVYRGRHADARHRHGNRQPARQREATRAEIAPQKMGLRGGARSGCKWLRRACRRATR